MRPKHPHAAESGVGKHTARESERAQACAAGKERVANAHPHNLALEPQGSGAILFLELRAHRRKSAREAGSARLAHRNKRGA